jgi:hypothetical protein
MALFTDGTISTLEDLRGYESTIYDLASTEGIDLSQKLVLAQQELEVELTRRFFADDLEHLGKVVVTLPLQLWHTFQTLALVYRDAYNSHLNDRYLGKWREYERQAKWAFDNLLAVGVGMVESPVPKAAPPVIATAPGTAAAAMYWARTSWIGQTGEEGCPSEPSVLAAADGSVPVITPGEAPTGVTGWNVYVSTEPGPVYLQNSWPIPSGESWTMAASGLVAGKAAGDGQAPTSYKRFERTLRRG